MVDPDRLRRQIFVYIGNTLMILWRVMVSLETTQPTTVRSSAKLFFDKDLGAKFLNITFIIRGLIPLVTGMGLQYVSLGLG
jgi:Ni/Fe-hydrogenase subunit HybB-like protein